MRFPHFSCTCLLIPFLTFSSVSAQEIQTPLTNHYQVGLHLYEEGYFEQSITHFNKFKQENQNSELVVAADFYITRALTASDSSKIEFYYHDFIQRFPEDERSVILLKDLGHRFTARGDYAGALQYYKDARITTLSNRNSDITQYWVAEAAAENGDSDQSRIFFLELADEFPESDLAPKALYARGRLYLSDEQYNSASEAFELLKERYPNNPITRSVGTALGESYYQQRKYSEAIEALNNAMFYLDAEGKAKAVFLMAESHNILGNYSEATKLYLQYINIKKGTEEERLAHYGLGWLYHKQQIYHWAAESFAKAIVNDDELSRKALYYKAVNEKLASNYGKSFSSFEEFGSKFKTGLWVEEAYYEWGIMAFENVRYSESIEILLELVRNQKELKNPAKVYTFLGEAYFANNEFTRATFAFEEAEKFDNIDPALKRQANFQKAWILFRNQAYVEAQPLFEAVYVEAPNTEIGSEALFWSADSYYKMDQFNRAAQRFDIFVKNYRDSELLGAARYSLGWSYFAMGEFEKAVVPLKDFLNNYNPPSIALFPYDTDTQLRIGDAYYALGEYDQAIEYYNKAIGAEPGGDYAMFQVANSFYRSSRTYEAVTTFRRVLRIYPFSRLREQAQYNIAYIYLNTDNYAQAVEEFQTVINKYPGTEWAARSQYNIGDSYYNAGDFPKAIAAYKQVLDDYPRSQYIIDAVNGIQFAQLSSGGTDSSSVVLEEFLGDNPNSNTADRLRFRQAENVYQTGDYEGAIREFRQYLRITNSDNLAPTAYANLGDSFRQTNKPDEAIDAFQTIVDEYADSDQYPPALISLGNLYFEKGEFGSSHRYFAELLANAPRYRQEAYIGMGNASLAQNQNTLAQSEYEEALKINANNAAASVGLGKVAVNERDYTKAESILTPIAERNTTAIGAEAQYYLGVIQQNQNNYEAAITNYAKVRTLFEAFDTWVALALYNSAECQIRLGNRGQAMNTLNNIVENYFGTEGARKAQELLDRSAN